MTRTDPRDRVSTLFKPIPWVITPFGSVFFCMSGWLICLIGFKLPLEIGYSWIGIYLILLCIQIEKPWLNIIPFPPLTTLVLTLSLRWTTGGTLLQFTHPIIEGDVIASHINQSIPLVIFPCAGIVLASWLINKKYIKRKPPKDFLSASGESARRFKQYILAITIATSIVAIGYILAGTIGGSLDRGESYLRWAGKLWRPDTLFSAVIRLRDIFYVCLPLAIYLFRRNIIILVLLIIPSTTTLVISSALGGRGLLLYPIVLMLGGLWLSGIKPKAFKLLIVGSIIFSLFFITFAAQLRQSSEFRATSSLDLAERARVIAEKATGISILDSIPNPRYLGFALYTHSDPYLFVEPTISSKPAGNKRLQNLKYLWVPRLIMQNRPEINDGHLIASEIRNESDLYMHNGRYVTFHNVSFGGDLYWRYRWPGVILGSALIGIAYSFVCRIWYSYASLNGSCVLLLVTLFPTTFFQGVPLRSISETAWNWLYEFPKYAIIVFALGIVIDKLCACAKKI